MREEPFGKTPASPVGIHREGGDRERARRRWNRLQRNARRGRSPAVGQKECKARPDAVANEGVHEQMRMNQKHASDVRNVPAEKCLLRVAKLPSREKGDEFTAREE